MVEEPVAYGQRKRGITLGEVCQAADAIARERQRPTVEKVRAKLGHGSPNTVGPMLDEWWARIVDRLDSGPAALHRLPEGVAHVAEALWLQALEEGRQQAAVELTSTTRTVEEQSKTLEARAHVLTLRESELEQRLRERERALKESQDQMMQLMRAVQRDQATIRARDTRVVALEAEIARYRGQMKAVLSRLVIQHRVQKRRTVTAIAKRAPSKRRTIPKKRPSAKRKLPKPRR